jgi:hypothetical protein
MRFCDAGKPFRGFSDVAGINRVDRTSQSQGRGHAMARLVLWNMNSFGVKTTLSTPCGNFAVFFERGLRYTRLWFF